MLLNAGRDIVLTTPVQHCVSARIVPLVNTRALKAILLVWQYMKSLSHVYLETLRHLKRVPKIAKSDH